jgi:hypothetical protein
MRVWFTLGMMLQIMCGSCQNTGSDINVKPSNFKLIIPFQLHNQSIIIDTYWGADKIKNELLWDNNSPTWVNEKVIRNNKSISKSKNFFYSTTTADGTSIRGRVYSCDSISLGQVTFVNVPFYKISDQLTGVFGDNLISKGVWEINFRESKMIFASSPDSLEDFIKQAQLFPSNFTEDGIKILISFRNNTTEDVDLDFGFNGEILLPMPDFLQIAKGNDNITKRTLQLSTPGNKNSLESTLALDTIQIQKDTFIAIISTNKLATEKLIGCGFFEQFEFVILDYKNKLFYVSKEKR